MRTIGLVLLVLASSGGNAAAQCGQAPVAGIASAPAPSTGDPKLDAHLAAWEKAAAAVKNYRFEIVLTRKDPPDTHEYSGVLLGMKPNLNRMRFDSALNPQDFEASIRIGDVVHFYSGLQKTISDHQLPAKYEALLGLFDAPKTTKLADHFAIKLMKADDYYIYLDLKPSGKKYAKEFQQIRVALYGSAVKDLAYLPAQVFVVDPSGTSELWKLGKPQTNLPGIDAKLFEPEEIPGFKHIESLKLPPEPMSRVVPASEIICVMPVAPCGQPSRGFRLFRSGLFRK